MSISIFDVSPVASRSRPSHRGCAVPFLSPCLLSFNREPPPPSPWFSHRGVRILNNALSFSPEWLVALERLSYREAGFSKDLGVYEKMEQGFARR